MLEFWTYEKLKRLKELAAAGGTGRMIAAELGCSRNAVMGKMHRLAIQSLVPARRPKSQEGRNIRPRATSPAPKRKPAKRLPCPENIEIYQEQYQEALRNQEAAPVETRNIQIFDLEPHHCRWPQGTPGAVDFSFCGLKKDGERPYCALHSGIAYRRQSQGATPDD